MRSFESWFSEQDKTSEQELPEGVVEGYEDGEYLAMCRCCGEWTPFFVGLDEVPKDGYEHWCGRGPSCCP